MLAKILIGLAFLYILYNLGAAFVYMMTDRGKSSRMANALTRRVGMSLGLMLLVLIAIWAGIIEPQGIPPGR